MTYRSLNIVQENCNQFPIIPSLLNIFIDLSLANNPTINFSFEISKILLKSLKHNFLSF